MIRRSIAAAGAAVVLLAAAPPARLDPVPPGSQTALVRRYVDALAAQRYADAFALLDPPARAYFRNARNFASGVYRRRLRDRVVHASSARAEMPKFRLYFAREAIRLRDPARDVAATRDRHRSVRRDR